MTTTRQTTASELPATDPNVESSDVFRLSGQNLAILRRLREGPATTDELSRISRKYTSRISDIRHHGFIIECERRHGGNNVYRLGAGS